MKRTLAPPEHVEHDATAADPWRMAVSAWIVVEEHRWLELDVLMRNAPPVVLRLFDTQYPLIVWKPTSYALPLPRSATNESQLRKLPVLAITAGRLSLLRKWTSLPRLKLMLLNSTLEIWLPPASPQIVGLYAPDPVYEPVTLS